MVRTLGLVELYQEEKPAAKRRKIGGLPSRRFGGQTLLEWIVRRVSDAELLGQIVIVAPESDTSELISRMAPANVDVYFCDDSDALSRMLGVAAYFEADAVVSIGVGDPFVDPILIDRLVTAAEVQVDCDYAAYESRAGASGIQQQLGLLAQWCKTDALTRADQLISAAGERANPLQCIYSRPEAFNLHVIPMPSELDRDDVRLRIDCEEDWEHAQVVLDALGPDDIDWQRITGLLDGHPGIRRRMAALNKRQSSQAKV